MRAALKAFESENRGRQGFMHFMGRIFRKQQQLALVYGSAKRGNTEIERLNCERICQGTNRRRPKFFL